MKPNYDTTAARIAGNIASGLVANPHYALHWPELQIAKRAVLIADLIIATYRARGPREATPA